MKAASIAILVAVVLIVAFFSINIFNSNESTFFTVSAPDYNSVVIVLSRGRSGSGMLCRVVANIVNEPLHSFTKELFGGTAQAMREVANPTQRMTDYLSLRRRKIQPDRRFIGFKWKPYTDNMEYDLAYQEAVRSGFHFVFMIRNPLDEFISREKHRASNFSFAPHCGDGDEACFKAEMSLKPTVHVGEAVEFINSRQEEFTYLRRKLRMYGARFVELSYENLTFGSDAQRMQHLQPVADMLLPVMGQPPRAVSMQDFDIGIEPTSASKQSDKVTNFDELSTALRASGLGSFLRD